MRIQLLYSIKNTCLTVTFEVKKNKPVDIGIGCIYVLPS